jgi:hypothetical protein
VNHLNGYRLSKPEKCHLNFSLVSSISQDQTAIPNQGQTNHMTHMGNDDNDRVNERVIVVPIQRPTELRFLFSRNVCWRERTCRETQFTRCRQFARFIHAKRRLLIPASADIDSRDLRHSMPYSEYFVGKDLNLADTLNLAIRSF